MEKNNINLILTEMKHIRNVATIMDMFFKPFEEFRQEKKYTVDEAIKAKDTQFDYLQKYGTFTIKTTLNKIENILKNHNTNET
jgi:hypothetical protein